LKSQKDAITTGVALELFYLFDESAKIFPAFLCIHCFGIYTMRIDPAV